VVTFSGVRSIRFSSLHQYTGNAVKADRMNRSWFRLPFGGGGNTSSHQQQQQQDDEDDVEHSHDSGDMLPALSSSRQRQHQSQHQRRSRTSNSSGGGRRDYIKQSISGPCEYCKSALVLNLIAVF